MPIDRRGFLQSATLLTGIALVGFRPPSFVRVDARAVLTVDGRRHGLRFTDFRGGRALVTVRELEGRRRWAFSYPSRERVGNTATLTVGGRSHRVMAAGSSIRTDLPGVSVGSTEGDAPEPLVFRGILVGIAVVIAAIRGDKVEIENSNGSKVTINGDGKTEEAETEGSEGGSTGEGGQSSGYRAEPGMEEQPGIWY